MFSNRNFCLITLSCLLLCTPFAVFASGDGGNCVEGQLPGCDGVCNSGAVEDECGVCNGDGPGPCGCDLSIQEDACGVCGGDGPGPCGCDLSVQPDECGVCGGSGPGECGCDLTKVKDDCGVCGGDGRSCLVGPCEDADIASVSFTSQKHDGVWTKFNGSQSSFDTKNSLYYQYIRDKTVVGCIKNPNTAGLEQTLKNGGSLDLFTDYKWQGRSSNRDKVSQQRQDQLTGRLIDLANGNSTSCFICGHVRKKKGCFPPEAELQLLSGASITAAEVSVGDVLLNPLTGKGLTVLQVIEGPEELPLIGIAYNGGYVRVSQDHPILTDSGVKAARDVTTSDKLFDAAGTPREVSSVTELPVEEGQRVINFMLSTESNADSDHMILADGVVAGDLILQWLLKERS